MSVTLIAAASSSVTGFDAAEGSPVPSRLVAVTVNVYVVPSDNPVTVIGLTVPDTDAPPGDDVTAYDVIDEPPSSVGATN
jgi:hypothetical protein